jgi:tetratricopeptide (TPR) repeat protein
MKADNSPKRRRFTAEYLPAMAITSGARITSASLRYQRGQPQAAIDPIQRSISVDGRHPECQYNLAFALQSVDRLNDAIGHDQTATRLKPNYVDAAHTNLGNVLTQLGRYDEAIVCYERVIKLKPAAEAICNLANVLARSGRLDEAIVRSGVRRRSSPTCTQQSSQGARGPESTRRGDDAFPARACTRSEPGRGAG